MANQPGEDKFWSCIYRSPDIVIQMIEECQSCPPRPKQGFSCRKLNLFPIRFDNCKDCVHYADHEEIIVQEPVEINISEEKEIYLGDGITPGGVPIESTKLTWMQKLKRFVFKIIDRIKS